MNLKILALRPWVTVLTLWLACNEASATSAQTVGIASYIGRKIGTKVLIEIFTEMVGDAAHTTFEYLSDRLAELKRNPSDKVTLTEQDAHVLEQHGDQGVLEPQQVCFPVCSPGYVCDAQHHTCVPDCNPMCADGYTCVERQCVWTPPPLSAAALPQPALTDSQDQSPPVAPSGDKPIGEEHSCAPDCTDGIGLRLALGVAHAWGAESTSPFGYRRTVMRGWSMNSAVDVGGSLARRLHLYGRASLLWLPPVSALDEIVKPSRDHTVIPGLGAGLVYAPGPWSLGAFGSAVLADGIIQASWGGQFGVEAGLEHHIAAAWRLGIRVAYGLTVLPRNSTLLVLHVPSISLTLSYQ